MKEKMMLRGGIGGESDQKQRRRGSGARWTERRNWIRASGECGRNWKVRRGGKGMEVDRTKELDQNK